MENVPAEDVCEYYKQTVTIPMLDYVLNSLKERFNFTSIARVQGFCAVLQLRTSILGLGRVKSENLRLIMKRI